MRLGCPHGAQGHASLLEEEEEEEDLLSFLTADFPALCLSLITIPIIIPINFRNGYWNCVHLQIYKDPSPEMFPDQTLTFKRNIFPTGIKKFIFLGSSGAWNGRITFGEAAGITLGWAMSSLLKHLVLLRDI